MDELVVGDVLHSDPLDQDGAWPLGCLAPQVLVTHLVVNWPSHSGDSLEVLGLVHTEKEVDLSFLVRVFLPELLDFLESSIEDLVSSDSGAPNSVLDSLVQVFFRVAFDDEEPRVGVWAGRRRDHAGCLVCQS